MKVLLVNDREEGGGAEIVYQQTYKLLQTASSIVNVRKSSPYMGRFSSAISIFGMFNLPYAIQLILEIVSYRPNIVHIHNYIYAVSPLALLMLRGGKRALGFKLIHTAHDFHLVCPNTGFIRYQKFGQVESCCRCAKNGRWLNVVKYNCDRRGIFVSLARFIRHQVSYRWLHLERAIDQIICPSEFLATQVRRVYPESCVVVLRNPAFVDDTSIDQKRKKRGSERTLGYLGRLQLEKGVRQFIENGYDVSKYPRFLIYGDGSEKDKIRSLIREKGLEGNIRLMGAVSHAEVTHAMGSLDAVVLPSLCHENCPLVVCDALKLGKKVVSSSSGGVEELLKARQNGDIAFLDVANYQEALIAIYQDVVISRCNLESA